jgi:hypothetical protein
MQGIFQCAREAFCLFQLHVTFDERANRGYFKDSVSLSTVLAANDVAVCMLDLRSERSRTCFASAASYAELKNRLLQLSCRHILCVIGIPILYPPHTTLHKIIDSMNPKDLNKFCAFQLKTLNKGLKQYALTAAYSVSRVIHAFCRHGPFGEPQLLDDLNDHWTCETHIQEQIFVLQLLLEVAASMPCHITILSGDVHTSCVHELAQLQSSTLSQLAPEMQVQPRVVNIVSSGIRHAPMPAVVAATVRNLSCQSNLPLVGKLWSVVPRDWQKVAPFFPPCFSRHVRMRILFYC